MDRYLIETPHKEQECLNLFELLNAQGYLTHFDWGWRLLRCTRDDLAPQRPAVLPTPDNPIYEDLSAARSPGSRSEIYSLTS